MKIPNLFLILIFLQVISHGFHGHQSPSQVVKSFSAIVMFVIFLLMAYFVLCFGTGMSGFRGEVHHTSLHNMISLGYQMYDNMLP